MGFLKIIKVEYFGDKYYFESPALDDVLSIVEGPNGAGKSTFFNLIYYGLGGKVPEFERSSKEKHVEITSDTNNLVRLLVSLSGDLYTLSRRIDENFITVFKAGEKIEGVETNLTSTTYPLIRREEVKTFSDWILEKLDIPVVEIFQGGKNFKLNFTDLSRLIYHNQSPDPTGIYKSADNVSFVSDSLEIRRAIFQILVGKTLLELYEAIGKQKLAERDLQAAKAVHEEYLDIVGQLLKASGLKEIQNTKSLSEQILLLQGQIEKLLDSRRGYSRGTLGDSEAQKTLEIELKTLREMEGHSRDLDQQQDELAQEAGRLVDVESSLNADIERINKVIYAHGQLNLFSRHTCPYCLNHVIPNPGHCVCGHAVEEHDYQRFFYSPSEYLDILRSKSKTLETLRIAMKALKDEAAEYHARRAFIENNITVRREKIGGLINTPNLVERAVEELDEKIFENKERLSRLEEAFRLESKLASLAKRVEDKNKAFDNSKLLVKQLDLASKSELQAQIDSFDATYNELMTTVLAQCRSAAIDPETYLPLINDGIYREASAKVPKRFLYYLTLLQLSLLSEIPFPRLLLIDTPETAGIDFDKLVKMISQISNLSNPYNKEFQIILSTGKNKFPPEYANRVVLTLTEGSLLQERKQ